MRHGRRLFLLVLLVATAVTALAAMPALGARQARPTNFRIYVNGRALSAAALSTAADSYVPVKAGRLSIGATWVTNLRGTGGDHRVVERQRPPHLRCRHVVPPRREAAARERAGVELERADLTQRQSRLREDRLPRRQEVS
jgi:hypothetical protein